jgi:hypothetical protein
LVDEVTLGAEGEFLADRGTGIIGMMKKELCFSDSLLSDVLRQSFPRFLPKIMLETVKRVSTKSR